MGRYIRVLTPSDRIVPVSALTEALATAGHRADIVVEAGRDDAWAKIALSHHNGPEIAAIQRTVVSSQSLGQAEIDGFIDEISGCRPDSSQRWLTEYLGQVRVIYGFQPLAGTQFENGWELLAAVRDRIWSIGGIIQADGEGFSNESGYHILWQFPDDVSGPWWMALLHEGKWVHFQMDLGEVDHRRAFFRGEVPNGVEIAHP